MKASKQNPAKQVGKKASRQIAKIVATTNARKEECKG